MGLGYLFSDLIEQIAAQASRLGGASAVIAVGLLGGYAGVKYVQRRRFLRELRMARISPDELKQRLDDGRETMIVDLRTKLDLQATPYVIPGALRISPDDLERRHDEIPRGMEIILYCTRPNEATSARAALQLRKRGVTRVRPLAGGFHEWHARGFPVAPASVDA